MLQEYVSFVFSVKEIKEYAVKINIKNSQEKETQDNWLYRRNLQFMIARILQDMRGKSESQESEMIFLKLLFCLMKL